MGQPREENGDAGSRLGTNLQRLFGGFDEFHWESGTRNSSLFFS